MKKERVITIGRILIMFFYKMICNLLGVVNFVNFINNIYQSII